MVNYDHETEKILEVKLSDFGLSRPCSDSFIGGKDTYGTIFYFAPEMLINDNPFDKRIDSWSLGSILHEMITGQHPFSGGTDI